jgi:uncharacterized protein YjbI with pentapeptide repeats
LLSNLLKLSMPPRLPELAHFSSTQHSSAQLSSSLFIFTLPKWHRHSRIANRNVSFSAQTATTHFGLPSAVPIHVAVSISFHQVSSAQLSSAQLSSAQLSSAQLRSTQVSSAQLTSSFLKTIYKLQKLHRYSRITNRNGSFSAQTATTPLWASFSCIHSRSCIHKFPSARLSSAQLSSAQLKFLQNISTSKAASLFKNCK